MILYAVVCGLWIPLNFWMMPWHALQVGQVCPHRPGLLSPIQRGKCYKDAALACKWGVRVAHMHPDVKKLGVKVNERNV